MKLFLAVMRCVNLKLCSENPNYMTYYEFIGFLCNIVSDFCMKSICAQRLDKPVSVFSKVK